MKKTTKNRLVARAKKKMLEDKLKLTSKEGSLLWSICIENASLSENSEKMLLDIEAGKYDK